MNTFNQGNERKIQNIMIEHLMDQRQFLVEKRNKYLSGAFKKGISDDVMIIKLEDIDKQIQELEGQIQKNYLKNNVDP